MYLNLNPNICIQYEYKWRHLSKYFVAVVDCGALPDLENGSIKLLESRTTHGAFADYTCKVNYTLVGDTRRRCGDGGIWSGHQPQCLCK